MPRSLKNLVDISIYEILTKQENFKKYFPEGLNFKDYEIFYENLFDTILLRSHNPNLLPKILNMVKKCLKSDNVEFHNDATLYIDGESDFLCMTETYDCKNYSICVAFVTVGVNTDENGNNSYTIIQSDDSDCVDGYHFTVCIPYLYSIFDNSDLTDNKYNPICQEFINY